MGFETYKGGKDFSDRSYSTQPKAPSTMSGGPMDTFKGGDSGRNINKNDRSWDAIYGDPKSGDAMSSPTDK